MSEMCGTRIAANTGAKNRHFGTIAQLCRAVSSQLSTYRQPEKNLLSSNTSSTCPHNMANFGLLTVEICWRVWGTPANFNGFRVLAALLHGNLIVGVSQTAALNRGRHLCSAERPSRWALAHFSSFFVFFWFFGRPFVKRSALCYQTVVCLSCPVCLSVTLMHYGQTVGWIKMKLGMQVGLSPGHIVLDGDPAPPPPKGHSPHNFWPISVTVKWLHGSRCH